MVWFTEAGGVLLPLQLARGPRTSRLQHARFGAAAEGTAECVLGPLDQSSSVRGIRDQKALGSRRTRWGTGKPNSSDAFFQVT